MASPSGRDVDDVRLAPPARLAVADVDDRQVDRRRLDDARSSCCRASRRRSAGGPSSAARRARPGERRAGAPGRGPTRRARIAAAPGSALGSVITYVAGTRVHRGDDRPTTAAGSGVEGRRMDRHDHERAAELDARGRASSAARSGRSGRNAASRPGAPTTWIVGRVLAERDHPAGVLRVAHEVEVGELGDRVAERVVERPGGLLAAVEVDDRAPAATVAAMRGRRRLEAVADQDEGRGRGVLAARSAAAPTASSARGGLDVGAAGRPPSPGRGQASSTRPARTRRHGSVDRVSVPGREVHAARRGAEARGRARRGSPTQVERRIPQSWRPVVRTAIAARVPGHPAAVTAPASRSSRAHGLPGRDRAGRCGARRTPSRRAGERPVPGRSATRSAGRHDRARRPASAASGGSCRATAAIGTLGRDRRLLPGPEGGARRAGSPRPSRRTPRARATPRDRGRPCARSSVRCFSTRSRAERDGRDRQLDARACGRTSRRAPRTRARSVAIAPQVGVLGPGRVARHAVEEGHRRIAGRRDRVERVGDLDACRPCRSRPAAAGPCARVARGTAGS